MDAIGLDCGGLVIDESLASAMEVFRGLSLALTIFPPGLSRASTMLRPVAGLSLESTGLRPLRPLSLAGPNLAFTMEVLGVNVLEVCVGGGGKVAGGEL